MKTVKRLVKEALMHPMRQKIFALTRDELAPVLYIDRSFVDFLPKEYEEQLESLQEWRGFFFRGKDWKGTDKIPMAFPEIVIRIDGAGYAIRLLPHFFLAQIEISAFSTFEYCTKQIFSLGVYLLIVPLSW